MATKTIPQLNTGSLPLAGDLVEIARSGTSFYVTISDMAGQASTAVAITGGTIAGVTLSATTITASSTVTLSPANANVVISPSGTGVVTINPATVGTINNVNIGGSTRGTLAATTGDFNSTLLATGMITGSAGVKLTGAISGYAASSIFVDVSSLVGRIQVTGADTSTNGTLSISTARSGGTNSITALSVGITGAVTIPIGLTVSAGGIVVTGNSTITGTLGGLTGLTVVSGGATITAGGLTVTAGGITVSASGITVTGNSTITGTLGGLTGLTVASGGASITGNTSVTSGTATFSGGAFTASPASANVVMSPTGTGLVTINPATAGAMDNMVIGATTPLAGTFTTLSDSVGNVRNIVQTGSDKTSSYSLLATDTGKYIGLGASGAIVIPNSVLANGNVVNVVNNTASTATITVNTTTGFIGGSTTAKGGGGTVTLAARGIATIFFTSATNCYVTGNVS